MSTPTRIRGKVDFRKDRDRNRGRKVDADGDEREDDEDDRLAVARRPVLAAQFLPSFSSSSFSPAAFSPGFMIRTCALSSSPTPPSLITRSPGSTPVDLHHLGLAGADLHRPVVRDVLVVHHLDDGGALVVREDR